MKRTAAGDAGLSKIGGGIIVDFGLGNLAALRHKVAGLDPGIRISSAPDDIAEAAYLLLPGVGHFARAMDNLRQRGILPVLQRRVIEDGVPILGICVGMQIFARHSEEGDARGLGWIDAEVTRFPKSGLKVPHIGWNTLTVRRDDPILADITLDQRFYFIHSYRVLCRDERDILAEAEYGDPFVAIMRRNNIVGVQFHPEKSHRSGFRIVANFLKDARSGRLR